MSVARRPRCWTAWKASAARSGPSHPCPPIRVSSASRRSSTMCSRWRPCRRSLRKAPTSIAISAWVGGGTASGRPVRAAQVGGPLGAYFPRALFDTPFDYEAFAARNGLIGHGGVVVFDDTVDMARQARFALEFCAFESCGKCTPCRIGSVRGVEVVDKIRQGQAPEANIALLEDLCETLKYGSLCALGGFTPYPVLSALEHFREDFTASAAIMADAE